MKRVYTDIVGDLFHIGHVEFLKKCKSFGDYLIVGICSDIDCAKDKRYPILSSEERAGIVKEIKCVDEIIVDAPYCVTEELITAKDIDLVIHAHTEEEHPYWEKMYTAAITKNVFKRIDRCERVSTTDILDRIKERIQTGKNKNMNLWQRKHGARLSRIPS